MNATSFRRNILLYKLFVLFNEPLFWGPVLISSLQQLGHMPLPDIYFMESAVMIICVLLDIPSGALADLIGKKKTLIIGRVFLLGSIIGFATMTSPLGAWIGNILWAIGFSFQSGADVSLFYSSLKSNGREKDFKQLEGCAVGSRLLLIAFCSLAVGPLAHIDLRIPSLLSIPFAVIPLVTVCFFQEPTSTQKYDIRAQYRILKEGILYVFKKPEIRWIVGFCTLLTGASKIWFFTYNPYFEAVNIDIRYYGVVFFCLNIVAWLSSHYAYKIEHSLSERLCIIGMVCCVGIPLLIMGLVPIWPMAFLVLFQNIVRGFIRPFRGDFVNRHIDSEHIRTTVLSVQSSTGDLIAIATLSCFGLLSQRVSLLDSLVVLGIIVLILGYASFRKYNKLFP